MTSLEKIATIQTEASGTEEGEPRDTTTASATPSESAAASTPAPASAPASESQGSAPPPPKKRVPLTVADKVGAAEACRQKGNALFKQGEFKKALLQYSRVFAYTTGLKAEDNQMAQYQSALGRDAPTPEEATDIAALQLATWSNMALCCLRLKQGPKALEHLDKVLAKEPENEKALCNRGKALILVNDLDKAQECLTRAAALYPANQTVVKELGKLPALVEQQRRKEKSTWKAAFDKF